MTHPLLWSQILLYSALSTALIEGVTVLFRYGFKLQSTRHTASTIGRLTGGIRIHHGYLGAVALVVGAVLPLGPAPFGWTMAIGGGLLLSDLIHHFLVLWPIEGSPQFDLVYPRTGRTEDSLLN